MIVGVEVVRGVRGRERRREKRRGVVVVVCMLLWGRKGWAEFDLTSGLEKWQKCL